MTIDGFDLAERLQTPVIIMSDLDLGMNDHMSTPLSWDDNRRYNRGKMLSASDLEGLKDWGRYLDIDGDGICYRTAPGAHPTKGSYFTRGSSHNEYSAYTEDAVTYERNMHRLLTKWETARGLMPTPVATSADAETRIGMIFFGTSTQACTEAVGILQQRGIPINSLRLRAFPFQSEVIDFITSHETVFVIEQNRDAQMRKLLLAESDLTPSKLVSILHFDGLPITAQFIIEQIQQALAARNS
jgi:2-oxoglutarate ferredoxin oxidoreductase subunit alpha